MGKVTRSKSLGIPENYRAHLRLMFDMMVLAFQSDSTRISSFLLAHDGSNRSFREIGVPEGHNSLSHHKNDPEKIKKLAKIDLFYSEHFAYFIDKLSTTQEIDGSRLLDHCMIIFGVVSVMATDIDILTFLFFLRAVLLGLTTGRHVDFRVPMTNLYLGMLNRAAYKLHK